MTVLQWEEGGSISWETDGLATWELDDVFRPQGGVPVRRYGGSDPVAARSCRSPVPRWRVEVTQAYLSAPLIPRIQVGAPSL